MPGFFSPERSGPAGRVCSWLLVICCRRPLHAGSPDEPGWPGERWATSDGETWTDIAGGLPELQYPAGPKNADGTLAVLSRRGAASANHNGKVGIRPSLRPLSSREIRSDALQFADGFSSRW